MQDGRKRPILGPQPNLYPDLSTRFLLKERNNYAPTKIPFLSFTHVQNCFCIYFEDKNENLSQKETKTELLTLLTCLSLSRKCLSPFQFKKNIKIPTIKFKIGIADTKRVIIIYLLTIPKIGNLSCSECDGSHHCLLSPTDLVRWLNPYQGALDTWRWIKYFNEKILLLILLLSNYLNTSFTQLPIQCFPTQLSESLPFLVVLLIIQ